MPMNLDSAQHFKKQTFNRLLSRRMRLARAHTCHRAKQAKVLAESSRRSLADLPAVLRSDWNFEFDFSDDDI
jgi:hypothetical protein